MKQIRKRLTYANVMSSIAVFLMLGGATAFAATKIGANEIKANSIKTGKIVKEAVTAGKIKNGAVTESKIANDAVTGGKVKDGSLTGSDINASTLGTVPNAEKLGGTPASSFQQKSEMLFATVAPAAPGAKVVRGRGVIAVENGGIDTIVTFNRDITNCTWLATYGPPGNEFVSSAFATVRGLGNNNQLLVVLRNDAGAEVTGSGFHIAVLCP